MSSAGFYLYTLLYRYTKDQTIEHKDQLHKEKEEEIKNLYAHIRVLEEFMAKVKATLPYKIYEKFFKKKGSGGF